MTHPTAGFGQTAPSPRRASANAARIQRRSIRLSLGDIAASAQGSVAIRGDPPDKIAEILGLAKVAVDRSETDVGDLVETGERLHDETADHIAWNIGFARALQLTHQRVDDALDPIRLDRPLAQGDVDRSGELVPVEGLALPVLFDDGQFPQLHALEGREASRAIRAEAPTADRASIIGRPRILDLSVVGSAKRTAHFLLLIGRVPRLASRAINRKAGGEIADILSHACLGRSIVAWPSRKRAQHLDDVAPDHAELLRAEPAGRRRWRAEANPRGHRRLLRIE